MIIGKFETENGALIEVSWEEVTPEIASEWLAVNAEHNRSRNRAQVEAIANDITDGFWAFNGATVSFDQDGVMLDAQHRCSAIVAAGIPVYMLVLRGLEPGAIQLMGQERPRSAHDLLTTSGRAMPYARECAAIVNVLRQIDPSLSHIKTRPHLADYVWQHRTTLQPLATWAKSVTDATSLWISPSHAFSGRRKDAKKAVNVSTLASLVYVMTVHHGADVDTVQRFWESVFSGIALTEQRAADKHRRTWRRHVSAANLRHLDSGLQPPARRRSNHASLGAENRR
ncbi:hypothetical protein [Mycobacterium kubicae]|uniref:hypothetical protein n=1 Tax=Mycobacterium kubicae TaxID=120959 RepID=UPI000A169047|nr:hypothetical protein [Mycobacterium kubicae]ORV97411.1 hypothetical protein AWC13_16490 [Mycobacterium kubicae]